MYLPALLSSGIGLVCIGDGLLKLFIVKTCWLSHSKSPLKTTDSLGAEILNIQVSKTPQVTTSGSLFQARFISSKFKQNRLLLTSIDLKITELLQYVQGSGSQLG